MLSFLRQIIIIIKLRKGDQCAISIKGRSLLLFLFSFNGCLFSKTKNVISSKRGSHSSPSAQGRYSSCLLFTAKGCQNFYYDYNAQREVSHCVYSVLKGRSLCTKYPREITPTVSISCLKDLHFPLQEARVICCIFLSPLYMYNIALVTMRCLGNCQTLYHHSL